MDNELLFYGLTILIFLLISAFFSAAETALTAITRARLYQLVQDGNRRAEIADRLRRNKESLIGTVLLGNNAVNIAASAIATALSIRLVGNSDTGLFVVTVVMTLLVVIFSEILPKTYAIQNSERVSLAVAPALQLLVRLLYPITRALQLFIRGFMRLFGVDIQKGSTLVSVSDALRGTIELHHREGRMVKSERDMLGSILDLSEREVKDIMIHRKRVETLSADLPPDDLIRQALATLHSRIPLWRGQPDNIIAVLQIKSLIKAMGSHLSSLSTEGILSACSKPWFVPETTRLRHQLLAFRAKRQHIALVVDEYGAWQGIVTLEDVIEEIVGDIDDEHDETARDIHPAGTNAWLVTGSISVRDLNRHLDWNLPEEATTIAGLLIHETQTIPAVGEHFDLHGFRFTVMEKAAAQINRLRIEKLPEPAEHDKK